jgi:hypothetical protein
VQNNDEEKNRRSVKGYHDPFVIAAHLRWQKPEARVFEAISLFMRCKKKSNCQTIANINHRELGVSLDKFLKAVCAKGFVWASRYLCTSPPPPALTGEISCTYALPKDNEARAQMNKKPLKGGKWEANV